MGLAINLVVVFTFFLIGAIFSAAEMALVSLRDSQVKALAKKGKRGRAVQQLMEHPNRFLSSVQIGVTLAGFASSSFGASSIGDAYFSPWLQRTFGLGANWADVVSLVLLTLAISYFSIVLSELTAKRLAMQRPEEFALGLAPFINVIAKLFRPLIWLLGVSTNALVRLLGFDPGAGKEGVSDAELRAMVSNAESLGAEERQIVDEVFDAGDRSLREVMVPRTEAHFLAGEMPAHQAIREVKGSPHSRYPVTDGSLDRIVGFLHVRDLMDLDPAERNTPVKLLARPVMQLPQTVKVLRALTDMRRHNSHLVIVMDEYGGTAGIVTLEDLVEELIGDITDEYDVVDTDDEHQRRSDMEGLTTLEEFADETGYELPEGPYDTVAGYLLAQFGRIPSMGDQITVALAPALELGESSGDGERALVRFTVTEMDERRIAWVGVHQGDQLVLHGATVAEADQDTRAQLKVSTATQSLMADLHHRQQAAESSGESGQGSSQ